MVIITLVYVVATIAIWRSNKKAASATEKQLEESKSQFADLNRPYVTCHYILSDRMFCGIRIQNYGNLVAKNLHIHVNEEFIDALNPKDFMDFYKVNSSVYATVGINQQYDLHFCEAQKKPRIPITVTLKYSDAKEKKYEETFEIDLFKQLPIQYVNSDIEKMTKVLTDIDMNIKALIEQQASNDNSSNQEAPSLSDYLGVRQSDNTLTADKDKNR